MQSFWKASAFDVGPVKLDPGKGNGRRLLERRYDGNSWLGRTSKMGLAPVLWCVIFVLLVIFTHSVIMAPALQGLTVGFGLFAWLGVLLATTGLVMLYRCSRATVNKHPFAGKSNAGNF